MEAVTTGGTPFVKEAHTLSQVTIPPWTGKRVAVTTPRDSRKGAVLELVRDPDLPLGLEIATNLTEALGGNRAEVFIHNFSDNTIRLKRG